MKGVNILPRKSSRNIARAKRHLRIRRHISGTATCPRLNVYRSLSNIYAQVIDDVAGTTLVAASSLDKDLIEKYGAPCPDAMVEAALRAATTLDDHNFEDYAFSVKASELNLCVSAYEQLAKKTDAPLHLGITEAGGLTGGTVLSSIGISWLLKQGIGDTLRVSLAADPVEEIKVGWAILKSMHLRTRGVEIVACPTCGRRGIDVVATVAELEKRLSDIKETLKIAVMGCVVNGPGEALHADIAVCGAANDRCLVYEDGQMMGKIPCSEAVDLIEKRVRARLDK